jgi:hypothetical protein
MGLCMFVMRDEGSKTRCSVSAARSYPNSLCLTGSPIPYIVGVPLPPPGRCCVAQAFGGGRGVHAAFTDREEEIVL